MNDEYLREIRSPAPSGLAKPYSASCVAGFGGMRDHNGELTFGLTGDYDCAPDLDVLSEGIGAAVKELLTA